MSNPKLTDAEVDEVLEDLRERSHCELYVDEQLQQQCLKAGILTLSRLPQCDLHRQRIAALDIVLAERRERKQLRPPVTS
jgi:hypothetical protein